MAGGAPTKYTYELAVEICDTIANTSKGLKNLCKENPHWPSRKVIYEWLIRHKEFRDLYAQAKTYQADLLFEECFEIADNISKDTKVVGEDQREIANNEWINRSRLRVDVRKWAAGKLQPRVYGDQAAVIKLFEELEDLKKKLGEKNG